MQFSLLSRLKNWAHWSVVGTNKLEVYLNVMYKYPNFCNFVKKQLHILDPGHLIETQFGLLTIKYLSQ
jgi:hypothetical protein